MKYAFIANHRKEFQVKRMCRVLGVTRSGFYAWQAQPLSKQAQANQALLEHIRTAYQTSDRTYGSPRIQLSLSQQGVVCGHNRVARLMRQHGIVAKGKRRTRPITTQRQAGVVPAPNRLNQDFTALAPNRKWASDFTFIDTAEGWLYLAVVLDLFSRKVVGWSMARHMDTALVQGAWCMALGARRPAPGLLHHSDQGSQYTSAAYLLDLSATHTELSMSRVGNCYDNAVVESFFATLKTECVTDQFATCALARTTIFRYIEVWYNRHRMHSTLGYLSPLQFELRSGQ
jgi:putative transposase